MGPPPPDGTQRPLSLADFEMIRPLGSGATARVFEARDRRTGQRVAVKMLEPASRASRELRARLEREAHALAGVRSPHVASFLGMGWAEEGPFLVLERLEGETLGDMLRRSACPPPPVLAEIIEQLLLGLRDCHRAQVIHRDVKPANVFLVGPGAAADPDDPPESMGLQVKLIDFGVARLKAMALEGASLTGTHHLIGSMGYMAPEQFEYAKGVGPAADLYAVGVVVFRCVAGRLPFVGSSFEAIQRMKSEGQAPRLSTMGGVARVEVLDEFVATALERRPEDRYGSAAEMLEAWWRVAAALNRGSGLVEPADVEYDIAFEDSTTVLEVDQNSPSSVLRRAVALHQAPTATHPVLRTLVEEEKRIARESARAPAPSSADLDEGRGNDGRKPSGDR